MKRSLVFLFLTFGLADWSPASDSQSILPLEQVVIQVLARDEGFKASQARVDEAEAGLKEAHRKRLPLISARSALTSGDNPVYVFGSRLQQGQFTQADFALDSLNHPDALTNIKSGLDLGVPLFTGLELTSDIRQRDFAAQEARYGRDQTAQGLRLQAASTYLDLLMAQSVLKELDARLLASKDELEEARHLKERGVVLGSDYYAAQAIYGGLQVWKIRLAAHERAMHTQLEILSGQAGISPQGLLRETAFLVPAESEARQMALAHRPDIASAASTAARAEESANQARRTILPRVDGFASIETNTEDFRSNPSNHLLGVALNMPFGDLGYLARRNRAKALDAAARSAQSAAAQSATLDVNQVYNDYQAAVESLTAVREAADNAAQSLKLFRPLYRSGRQSIIEVLRAEDALAKAKAAYWQTMLETHAGYLRLMAAIGTLDEKAIRAVAESVQGQP